MYLWMPLAHLGNYGPPISMQATTTARNNALACLYTPPQRAMFLAYACRSAAVEIPFILTIQMATQQFISTWIRSEERRVGKEGRSWRESCNSHKRNKCIRSL